MPQVSHATTLITILAFGLVACSPGAAPASQPASSKPTAPVQAPAQAAAPATQAPARPAQVEQIKVAFAADSAIYAPHFISIEKGYLAEEGLEMEMIRAGGGVATPALVSCEIHYSTSAASSVSASMKGAPIKVIYTNADRPGYELWSSSPDIRTLQDLVGKTVAIQSRGDTMEIATRMVLMKHGIDPDSVVYSAMGVGAQRLAAVQQGTVAAAVLGTADVVQLKESLPKGHLLSDRKQEAQMLYTGVATSDTELREHRDRVKRFLRATIKGREYFKAFKAETLAILDKYNDRPRHANEADYEDVLLSMTEDGSIPADVQQRDTQIRAAVNQLEQVPPIEQIYDYSLVKEIYAELRASGWRPTR